MRCLVMVCAIAIALALLAPRVSAQAVQQYEYAPDRIYSIRTGLGITTQIELSPDEEVVDYSAGFSNGWELTRRDNVFYVKPKNVDVDTNLVVRTEMHTYIFELRVVATDWRALDQAKNAGVQYKVAFTYPKDTRFRAENAAEKAPALSTQLEPGRPYHFDYHYATRTRSRALVPVNVYDDGQFTYIRLSDASAFPSGDFPAVFGREREDGEDFVVNTTVEGGTIVVHGTYRYLVIRHGANVVGLRRNAAR